MIIYAAGHTGMVECYKKKFLKNGYTNLLLPRKELDLLNNNSVKDWFNANNPDVVILAAAKVGEYKQILNFPVILF